MTDMNPYPSASEAVDTHLSKSIENLQRATEQGIGRIETRMGEMATKEAVAAHVARLDQRDDHLESRLIAGFDSVKSDMTVQFAAVATRDAERDGVAEKRENARQAATNRRMGWMFSGLALMLTVWTTFVAPLFQHR